MGGAALADPEPGGDEQGERGERPLRALGLVSLASVAFASLSAAIKVCQPETGISAPILARGVVGLVCCLAYAVWRRRALWPRRPLPLLLRCTSGIAAMYAYYWAFTRGGTDLPTAAVFLKTAPLWVALLAPLLLRERSGRWIWVALAVGAAGVALRSQAAIGGEGWGLLASVLAGLLAAIAYLSLRALARESTLTVVTWFSLALILLPGLGVLLGEAPRPLSEISPRGWGLLALVGVLGTLGQLFLTAAYANGRAAAVTIGGLGEVGLALAFSIGVFGERVTPAALCGGGLALAAGILASLPQRQPAGDPDPADPAARAAQVAQVAQGTAPK